MLNHAIWLKQYFYFCRFRVMCHFICNHSYFGNIVLVCIMISSAMLAAEDPLRADSPRNKVSEILIESCYYREYFRTKSPGSNTLINFFKFLDLELLRLFFYNHIHNWSLLEGHFIWLYFTPWRILQSWLQSSGPVSRGSFPDILYVQVRINFL